MKKLTLSIFISLIFFSCEKEVVLDLADKEGTYIIVEANLTDGGYRQWIRLSASTSYYETEDGTGLTGAIIWVENENDPSESYPFFHTETDSLRGNYYNDQISANLEGKTMKLIIEYNDRHYTAISKWRPLPDIDSLSMTKNPFSQLAFFNDTLYDMIVHFKNLKESRDYYLFNLYFNGTLRSISPSEKGLLTDAILSDYVSMPVVSFNSKDVREGDEVTVEMRSISRENFEFYNIFFFQTDLSGNPFAGAPPANIPTNLSNGAKGFFQISAIKKETIIYSPLP